MMLSARRLLLLTSVLSTAVLTFIGTTYATSEKPDFPSTAVVGATPPIALPSEARALLDLTPDMLNRYGISSDSYEQARILSQTEAGPVYAVPGSSGVCLSLQKLIVCGDRTDPVAVLAPHGGYLVGAGYLPNPAKKVAFKLDDGRNVTADLVPGGFVVGRDQNLIPGAGFELAID